MEKKKYRLLYEDPNTALFWKSTKIDKQAIKLTALKDKNGEIKNNCVHQNLL